MGNTHQDTSRPENMERGGSGYICAAEILYFEFEFELIRVQPSWFTLHH